MKIGAPHGPALQIDELGVGPPGKAAVLLTGKNPVSFGNRVEIELHHMAPRRHAFEVEHAALVGNHEAAVFEVDSDPFHPLLVGVDVVAAGSDENPPHDDVATLQERLLYRDRCARRVGEDRRGGCGSGNVDGSAGPRSGADPDHVADQGGSLRPDVADREGESAAIG